MHTHLREREKLIMNSKFKTCELLKRVFKIYNNLCIYWLSFIWDRKLKKIIYNSFFIHDKPYKFHYEGVKFKF